MSKIPTLRRCGCAATIIDFSATPSEPDWIRLVSLPGKTQTVNRGELYAIIDTLLVLVRKHITYAHIKFATDSKFVANLAHDIVQQLKENTQLRNMDLWTQYAELVSKIGRTGEGKNMLAVDFQCWKNTSEEPLALNWINMLQMRLLIVQVAA